MNTSGDEIDPKLRQIFASVLRMSESEVTPELSRGDCYDWDSLSHMELIIRVEKSFGLKLSLREVASLEDVGQFNSAIRLRNDK